MAAQQLEGRRRGLIVRHSVFTLELCARFDGRRELLAELRALVAGAPAHASRAEAWERHRSAATVLLQAFDFTERGCWDYFDDEQRANATFDDWCAPILKREVPRTAPSGFPDGYREAGPRYLTFTFVYLLARDSPSDVEVRRRCAIPDGELWTEQSFRTLLGVVSMLSFASVKSDAMYLVPRDDDWGLTPEDLAAPKYDYLRTIARAGAAARQNQVSQSPESTSAP
jgi:hypothetical protein